MSGGFPRAGLGANLLFNLLHVLPNVLQGLFTRRRFWVGLFSRLGTDRRTVRLVARLRRRHRGAGAVWVRLLASRSLLLFDAEAVRRMLDRSPDVYADPRIKRRGMSHFQPGAVTISHGDDWRVRRRFNEAVLDSTPWGFATQWAVLALRSLNVLQVRLGRSSLRVARADALCTFSPRALVNNPR